MYDAPAAFAFCRWCLWCRWFSPRRAIAALAGSLRKLPLLREIHLARCDISDEGVATLMANLGKDDFKGLKTLSLKNNKLTDQIYATLISTLNGEGLPVIGFLDQCLNGLEDEEPAAAVEATRPHGQLTVPINFAFEGAGWPILDGGSSDD